MTTLGTMKSRIADELARSDLTTQIAAAIDSAIAFYEGRRFWFNESYGSFTLVSGQDTYTSSLASFLTDMVEPDGMRLYLDSTSRVMLAPLTFGEMMDKRTTSAASGDPEYYAFRNGTLYLWPVPNAALTLEAYTVSKLSAITTDTGYNAWMREGEELIRLHAKVDLLENVIREDPPYPEAARLRQREEQVLRELLRRTGGYQGAGFVRASYL